MTQTLPVMILAAAFAGALGGQAIPASTPVENSSGEIAGIVVSARTGEPLRSAQVVLRGARPGPGVGRGRGTEVNENAVTGIDGRFVFTGLRAGAYTVFSAKTGFGTQRGPGSQAHVPLGEGQSRPDLVLRLQPAAVISGRVLDAFGEPLPEARISALNRSYRDGRARWGVAESARTDDLGDYRLHGLRPGRYVIRVTPPEGPSPRGVAYWEFGPSFFPAAASPEEATAFRIDWGAEMTGIDFRLDPAPETIVQGIVIDSSSGQPCECSVSVEGQGGLYGIEVTPTREGVFALHGVPSGSQRVMAYTRGRDTRFDVEQVLVPQSGTVEVHLVAGSGQVVTGEVVLEGPPKEQEQALQGGSEEAGRRRRQPPIIVTLTGDGQRLARSNTRATAPSGGGPFELENIAPGAYRVQVRSPGGGYLRAVSLGGRVLETPEITVAPDASLLGLRLHVAYDGAAIAGVVKSPAPSDEAGAGSGAVALVPEPGSNPYAVIEFVGVRPDGAFQRQGIAPGSYTAYAIPREVSFDLFDFDDPEVRRELAPFAKRVTLSEGENVNIELEVVGELAEAL
jgi:hypothetical protein